MVAVGKDDRDVRRFIWVDNPFTELPKLKTYQFMHVIFGVSSSPFLLNATIRFHLEKHLGQNEILVKQLLCSTYVADIIAGGQTEEEVLQLCSQSKEIFCEGGFNLRKFLMNSKSVQQQIELMETSNPPFLDELTYSKHTLGTSQPATVEKSKVLGILWSPKADCFHFDVAHLAQLAENSLQLRGML